MSKRAIRRTLIVLCALILAVIAFLLWTDLSRRVTQATFMRIRNGCPCAG
jgi:hypothetical protein